MISHIEPESLINKLYVVNRTVKSGKWQGVDTFKEMDMLVLRNETLEFKVRDKEWLRDFSGADQPWAELHFLERINGIPSNPGETYKMWPYHTDLDKSEFKDETFSHTYQERFWPKEANDKNKPLASPLMGIRFEYGDLEDVINLLKENPLTRQAYLPIWFPEDTWAANNSKRVPCTLGYYFWIDQGQVHMNYTIRSCDAFRHFRNDIYLTGRLLIYVAKKLKLLTGNLTMIIYNFHLFKNDMYTFNKKEFRLRNGTNR